MVNDDRVKACMHMLRHVDDVRELRKNPLAAPLFSRAVGLRPGAIGSRQALATLRRILWVVLEHLRTQSGRRIKPAQIERQYAIVTRCDLVGERPEAVAADLGICMRQFYRERRSACAVIAPEIARLIHEEVREPARVFDRFSMAFTRVSTLRLTGSIDAALAESRSLLAQEPAAEKKAAVLAQLIHILLEDSRIGDAQRELDAGSAHLSQDAKLVMSPLYELPDILRAHVDYARGKDGNGGDGDRRLTQALGALSRSPLALWREFACTSLLAWSEHEALLGRFAASHAHLREVDAIVLGLGDPSPHLQSNLLLQTAFHQYHVAHREDRAREQLDMVSAIARRYGFIEAAASALCGESSIAQGSGAIERALQLAREAEQLSRIGTASVPRARVLLRLCELEAGIGDVRRSLELSIAATNLLPAKSYRAMGARYEVARAHRLLGNNALATREAMQLYRDASSGGSGRLAGSALRLAAEAQSSAGKLEEAAEVIAEAIVLLERHGHAFSLCRAYEVSARVTGNRDHARRVREIHALYRAS